MNEIYQSANADNVAEILRRFADCVERNIYDARTEMAMEVNCFLDGLCEQGYFGMEMQDDPRGGQ